MSLKKPTKDDSILGYDGLQTDKINELSEITPNYNLSVPTGFTRDYLFVRKIGDFVEIKGIVYNNSGTSGNKTIATLPPQFRPDETTITSGGYGNAARRVTISATGSIIVENFENTAFIGLSVLYYVRKSGGGSTI